MTIIVVEALGDSNQIPGARTWAEFDSEEEITAYSKGKKVIAYDVNSNEAIQLCAENSGVTMARRFVLEALSGQELDLVLLAKAKSALAQSQTRHQFLEELYRFEALILSLQLSVS